MGAVELNLIAGLVMIGPGAFEIGRQSRKAWSPLIRGLLLGLGVAMPFFWAAGGFLFFRPSAYMTYNILPFMIALAALPVSAVMTIWGHAQRGPQ